MKVVIPKRNSVKQKDFYCLSKFNINHKQMKKYSICEIINRTLKILILIFLTNCNNNSNNLKIKSINIEDIKIDPPNCPNYQFESLKYNDNSLFLKINCNQSYFFYLREREYFLYCLKNLKSFILQNTLTDTIYCEYNFFNQENRKMEIKISRNEALKAINLRDSFNYPIFHTLIENVINDSNYNSTIAFMSYIYGKATIGDSYEFYDDADIFDFYFNIDNEIQKKIKEPQTLRILHLMELNMKKSNNIYPIDIHIRFIKNLFYKK